MTSRGTYEAKTDQEQRYLALCAGGVVTKGDKEHTCPKCKGEKFRKEPASRTAQVLIDYVRTCRAAHGGRMFSLLK